MIIPSDHFSVPGQDGEKYNLVLTPSGKWGYADDRGRLLIDAQYEMECIHCETAFAEGFRLCARLTGELNARAVSARDAASG